VPVERTCILTNNYCFCFTNTEPSGSIQYLSFFAAWDRFDSEAETSRCW